MTALNEQVGGSHYKDCKIQPIQYIEANKLSFLEACVVKRVTRHDKPTGKGRQDIEKAIHELQLLLELRYGPASAKLKDGYMLCPYCREVTRKDVAACVQCKQAMPVPRYDEARMDVIGQNGNDGEHYETPWVRHVTEHPPVATPATPVFVRWRSRAESDIPLMAGEVDWTEVIAYRLA